MIDLGSQIDVPATAVAEGRVFRPQRPAEQQRRFPQSFTIHHGATPPGRYSCA